MFAELQERHLKRVIGAYDGSKSVYFARRPFVEESCQYSLCFSPDLDDKEREFIVTLKLATRLSIDVDRLESTLKDTSESMPVIQALDVILRHLPSLRMEPIGRSFFCKPSSSFPLGSGREVWSGYYQSVRPVMGWKMMLNIDTASTAFYSEQSVYDFMCTILRRCSPRDATKPLSDADRSKFSLKELTDSERNQFSREIKGLKIVVSHLPYPRKYKIVDVTRLSVRKQTFPLDDGSQCTVENYFKEKYPDSHIEHPLLPCLHVGQKSRNVYLPIDVCTIVGGQRCVKKLTDIQTSNMIRHTAKPANERKRLINDAVRGADFEGDSVIQEFKIGVDTRMMEVQGRLLDPPRLEYSGGRPLEPQPGKGAWEMKNGAKFYHGARLERWAVLVCSSCKEEECERFISMLIDIGNKMGMTIHDPSHVQYLQRRSSVEKEFRKIVKDLDLIVAIVNRDGYDYRVVKRLGDPVGGVAVTTQCVLSDTVQRKCNPATISNLCLKINARMGGMNSIIDLGTRPKVIQGMPVIIFGADVTHPRSDDTTSPSIASVVASVDLEGGRYRALHHNQKHRQEIIADLKDMTKEHLKAFRICTKKKPVKIIFYRDGVSEGQFDAVRFEEIAALQKACRELEGGYQPKITFIVVQKRHHTRFFPKDGKDAGKGKNVPPGTIVDREITHPTQHDFYLCSHAAIQGTSRPCHYHVLWDDSDFSANDLQTFSYQLCHMFWRCNRSVSYPAPTYYAHRDAAHARMLLQAHGESSRYITQIHDSVAKSALHKLLLLLLLLLLFSEGSSIRSDEMSREDMNSAIEIHSDRKKGMYFM